MVNNWLNIIQNCLLPPTCILCGNAGIIGKDICAVCLEQLVKNTHACERCGRHLSPPPSNHLCQPCLLSPPPYDRTVAPFVYQGSMRFLIRQLKFNDSYPNARLLGLLLAEQIQDNPLPQCIMPVPLHPNRYRERGFNQSIEIAKVVARQLKIPLELTTCIRQRDTPHQTGLSAKQRDMNIHGAFSISKTMTYHHIAILDDVMTKGATVGEIARNLKQAGAIKIDVWVCARTPFFNGHKKPATRAGSLFQQN
jgi:ComF family protein